MSAIRKSDLVFAVAMRAGINRELAQRSVDALLESITAALRHRHPVIIPGFGRFEVRPRAARTVRNPRTGAAMDLPPRSVPAFAPGKRLRESVSEPRRSGPASGG